MSSLRCETKNDTKKQSTRPRRHIHALSLLHLQAFANSRQCLIKCWNQLINFYMKLINLKRSNKTLFPIWLGSKIENQQIYNYWIFRGNIIKSSISSLLKQGQQGIKRGLKLKISESQRIVGLPASSSVTPGKFFQPASLFRRRCFAVVRTVWCSICMHTWKTFLSH